MILSTFSSFCFIYLTFIVDKKAHTHQLGDDSVYLLGLFPLDRFAILQPVKVQNRITETVVINRVVVDEDMTGFRAMLKALDGSGEIAVGLLYSGQYIVSITLLL